MTQAAFSGAVAGLRLMVDDTVRITIDFEPKDRAAVMAALGRTGQPVAVAALVIGHAAKEDKPRDQRGPLCREACDLCAREDFRRWIAHDDQELASEADAKLFIMEACGIMSRKELDEQPAAAERFRRVVRKPFLEYVRNA